MEHENIIIAQSDHFYMILPCMDVIYCLLSINQTTFMLQHAFGY